MGIRHRLEALELLAASDDVEMPAGKSLERLHREGRSDDEIQESAVSEAVFRLRNSRSQGDPVRLPLLRVLPVSDRWETVYAEFVGADVYANKRDRQSVVCLFWGELRHSFPGLLISQLTVSNLPGRGVTASELRAVSPSRILSRARQEILEHRDIVELLESWGRVPDVDEAAAIRRLAVSRRRTPVGNAAGRGGAETSIGTLQSNTSNFKQADGGVGF